MDRMVTMVPMVLLENKVLEENKDPSDLRDPREEMVTKERKANLVLASRDKREKM